MVKTLLDHDWPGNVRELENCIERAVVLAGNQELTPRTLLALNQGARRLRPNRPRGNDLQGLIQHLVRVAMQTIPVEEGSLYDRVVCGVERNCSNKCSCSVTTSR